MARFDPGDDNATELVSMRPPAPQGYSVYQGYPGPSRDIRKTTGVPSQTLTPEIEMQSTHPEQDTTQHPDLIQIILLMCRTITKVTPREVTTVVRSHLREGVRMEGIRSSQNWWLTTPRETNDRPDMYPDNDPDRYETVRGERYDGNEYDRNCKRDWPESLSAYLGPTHYTHEYYYEDEQGSPATNIQFKMHIIVLIYIILLLYSFSQFLTEEKKIDHGNVLPQKRGSVAKYPRSLRA